MSAALFPFVGRYFTGKGYRLHYIDEGKGPVLVFLHGNPTWSFYWRSLLSAFREKYRVIAIDHLGCGLSDKPQNYDYTLKNHIANTTAVLDSLSVADVTLVVHDWGGAIGMGYAAQRPERIKRFVVFNTAAFRSDDMPVALSLCRVPGLGRFLIQGLNGFALGATYLATEKGMSREVRRAYLRPYDTYRNRIATYQFVQDIPMNPKHPSWETLRGVEEGLARFQSHPMTLIWGEKDWVFHTGFLKEWRRRFPKAEAHILKGAGHYVVEDAPEQVIPLVRDFLERTADHALF